VLLTGFVALSVPAVGGISACGSNSGSPSGTNDGGPVQIAVDPRADPAMSTINAEPQTLPANGTSTAKVTVALKVSDGTPARQVQVVLTSSGKGAVFNPASGRTDEQGLFSATMTSTYVEAKTATATFNGGSIHTLVNFQLCHDPLFFPRAPRVVGSGASAMATGDFDGDHKIDLAVVNTTDHTVSILLGDGAGSFAGAPTPTLNIGAYAFSIATGDFNGDGTLDLAVANSNDNTVSILMGNGAGSFAAAPTRTVGVGSSPVSVTTGDFNKDGKFDLAVVNNVDKTVSILCKPLADRMAARGEVLMHDSGHGNGFVEEGQVAKATDA